MSIHRKRLATAFVAVLFLPLQSAWAQGEFERVVFYPAGPQPIGVAIGDLDGDGDGDLAVVNSPGHLHLLFNNGSGSFGNPVALLNLWSPSVSAVALDDLDRDGDLDLAATVPTSVGAVSILLNLGNGAFGSPAGYDTCFEASGLTIADLDGDGQRDIASTSRCFTASVLLNGTPLGPGTFVHSGDYGDGFHPRGIDAADLDGDGDRDVVYANHRGLSTVTVILNDGNGAFGPHTWYPANDGTNDVRIADLDGDGDADVVASNFYSGDLSVLTNNGNGAFAPAVQYPALANVEGIDVGDLDLDGDLDVAAATSGADTVAFFWNSGNAVFSGRQDEPVGSTPEDVAIGDLNGDARPDVVVTNSTTNNVAVFINKTRHTPDHDDDGVTTASDCAPTNRSAWAVPSPAADLFLEGRSSTRLSWYPPEFPGGNPVRYDVLRSTNPTSFTSAACLASNQMGRIALDVNSPPSGGFYYLIRARNVCGATLGSRSDGTPRSGVSCP